MNHILDTDAVARRGAPYPYADPLPDEVRRAHTRAVNRAMAWCAAVSLTAALGGGAVSVVLSRGSDDMPSGLATWILMAPMVGFLVIVAPIVWTFLRRAQRHSAVLAAYPGQSSRS